MSCYIKADIENYPRLCLLDHEEGQCDLESQSRDLKCSHVALTLPVGVPVLIPLPRLL